MEIIASILSVARNGAAKTRIMYTAYVTFPQSQSYLKLLIDKGLLEYNGEKREYRTTAEGVDFLKRYEKMKSTFDSDQIL